MIAGLETLFSALPPAATADGVPHIEPPGRRAFTQLLSQLLGNGTEMLPPFPLKDAIAELMPKSEDAPDPEAVDILESLLGALYDLLQSSLPTPAAIPLPVPGSSGQPVTVMTPPELPQSSVLPYRFGDVQQRLTELPSPLMETHVPQVSDQKTMDVFPRFLLGPEETGLPRPAAPAVLPLQVKSLPLPPGYEIKLTSEPASVPLENSGSSLAAAGPLLPEHHMALIGSAPIHTPNPPAGTAAGAQPQETPIAHRFSIVPPETASRLLGNPLPRNTILLQLYPPELGRLQVQVQISNDQLAATFWADSAEVRTLLHSHFPALQQSLTTQGFHAHQIALNLAAGDFTGNSGQYAQHQPGFRSYFSGHGNHAQNVNTMESRHERSTVPRHVHTGLLDVVI